MKKEYEMILFHDFPILYIGRHMPETENLMCDGFCCNNGWFNIIYDLSRKLENYNRTLLNKSNITIEDYKNLEIKPIIADQVKSKYGELRYYISDESIINKEIRQYVIDTMKQSINTCEYCGVTDNIELRTVRGFFMTLCENCYNKIMIEMKKR